MLLYIVRHGDPDYATDSLLPRGVLQAEAVAKRLEKAGIDRIFTSPLGRARQTAEPLCRLLDKEYTVEPWTYEVNARIELPGGEVHSLANVAGPRFREDGLWARSAADGHHIPFFEGTPVPEEYERIAREGDAFLERLGYREENGNYRILQPNKERIALFCHGNFARFWVSHLLKLPLHMMLGCFSYNHTGVTLLYFKNTENGITAPRCLTFSDVSHLYAHGPDTDYNGFFPV